MKKQILHITPHLGGGVGHVLLNYVSHDTSNTHVIAALDYANEKALNTAKQNDFVIHSNMHSKITYLLSLIKYADIVLVHFWNHPLLYDFLLNNALPPARMIFWSHISGIEPPYVFTDKILGFPDKFVFTTPLSFDTEEVKNITEKDKLSTIFSTGGIEHVASISPEKHDGFNIGYIGTVDYAKMHPEFIETHQKIKIDNVKFIVVGGDNEKEIAKKADDRFTFTGKVADIKHYLAQMDVFGYLLSKKHYGTAEQVLQEAMAAGVVPVVLNNPTESFIVKHMQTGLVAKNLDEYISFVETLYHDSKLRNRLSGNARKHAQQNFSLNALCSKWDMLFDETMQLTKKEHKYSKQKSYKAIDLFLHSLGKHNEPFISFLNNSDDSFLKKLLQQPEWQSKTKGTPKQYYQFFKNDAELKKIIDCYNK